MDNNKGNTYYLEKLDNDLNFICNNMSYVEIDEFVSNELLQDSMMFRLIQISENAKKLSNDYKIQHNEIPWNDIYGL